MTDEYVFELTAIPIDQGMIAAREIVELFFDGNRPPEADGAAIVEMGQPPPDAAVQASKAVRPVERIYASASRQVRDRDLVELVRTMYADKCAVCGKALQLWGGATYSEVGHIKPVGLPFLGPDHINNVLPFCPNHHRQFDRGAVYFEIEGAAARVIDLTGDPALADRAFQPHANHALEPIREVWIHDEGFAAIRLSMMRIMARRTKATVVRA